MTPIPAAVNTYERISKTFLLNLCLYCSNTCDSQPKKCRGMLFKLQKHLQTESYEVRSIAEYRKASVHFLLVL